MSETVTLSVNGQSVAVPASSMVSAAIAVSRVSHFRSSIKGERRGAICGMGICFECRVTIDGEAHQRSCQTPCREGMVVMTGEDYSDSYGRPRTIRRTTRTCDVLVVGSGPAGLAAAWAASKSGSRVTVIDDNQAPGGQIWRSESKARASSDSAKWFERVRQAKIDTVKGGRVFDASQTGRVLAETTDGVVEILYQSLILATGARERFLPFPGWSLPNVCGAGGLQALVKSGLPIEGKRVVVAGSGPLLLAVADYLRKRGADLVMIAEQAALRSLLRFSLGLLSSPKKMVQAVGLKRRLAGVKYLTGCWPVAAEGNEELERVTLRQNQRTWKVSCDFLACGFHLVPNLEIALLLGCELNNNAVRVDRFQETSIENVFCAGEATGIGGLELSLVEGQIAGFAATNQRHLAEQHIVEKEKLRGFTSLLNRTFELRDELRALPNAETIVCRCEDVSWAELQQQSNWRSAKLHTRCGMGPCQGRVCGAAIEFLLGWGMESVRPPIFPVRLSSLSQFTNK